MRTPPGDVTLNTGPQEMNRSPRQKKLIKGALAQATCSVLCQNQHAEEPAQVRACVSNLIVLEHTSSSRAVPWKRSVLKHKKVTLAKQFGI